MDCQVLPTGMRLAKENMQLDAELLGALRPDGPMVLHLYEWSCPSITYGYFLKPERWLDLAELERRGIDLARRPTGGGAVFHLWDYAFSLLLPASHPAFQAGVLASYQWVNERVMTALAPLLNREALLIREDMEPAAAETTHFCMARPTQYDVVLGTRKVVGAAQRRTKEGLLHQGTIALMTPDEEILQAALGKDSAVAKAMLKHTLPLASSTEAAAKLRHELPQILVNSFTQPIP